MKKAFLVLGLLLAAVISYGQAILAQGKRLVELPVVYLPVNSTVHFVSPENIQYIDISLKALVGDLPVKNIARLKYKSDSLAAANDAIVTIVGEKFMAQYRIIYSPPNGGAVQSDVDIVPADMRPLEFPAITLSQNELRAYALSVLKQKGSMLRKAEAFEVKALLNGIYSFGDYIFLDVGFENKGKLGFDIDALRFSVQDQKITKASTVQSLELQPELSLFDIGRFQKHYRNVFVFKKFTFPGHKVLHMELSEKQVSGRVITLDIPYRDLLNADIVPLE